MSDGEMSRAINERQMDVLVDLVGLIRNHRHAILILRPAPLQVNTVYDKYTHTHTHTHTRARAHTTIMAPLFSQKLSNEKTIADIVKRGKKF